MYHHQHRHVYPIVVAKKEESHLLGGLSGVDIAVDSDLVFYRYCPLYSVAIGTSFVLYDGDGVLAVAVIDHHRVALHIFSMMCHPFYEVGRSLYCHDHIFPWLILLEQSWDDVAINYCLIFMIQLTFLIIGNKKISFQIYHTRNNKKGFIMFDLYVIVNENGNFLVVVYDS